MEMPFCLFLTQHDTVTASFIIFCDVPMAAATSRDGQTVAAVDCPSQQFMDWEIVDSPNERKRDDSQT